MFSSVVEPNSGHGVEKALPAMAERPVWFRYERKDEGDPKFKITRPVPEAYEIKVCSYGKGMFAKKDFKTGDVLYTDYWHTIPDELGSVLLVVTNPDGSINEEINMDVLTHTVVVANDRRQLFAVDGFMNQ